MNSHELNTQTLFEQQDDSFIEQTQYNPNLLDRLRQKTTALVAVLAGASALAGSGIATRTAEASNTVVTPYTLEQNFFNYVDNHVLLNGGANMMATGNMSVPLRTVITPEAFVETGSCKMYQFPKKDEYLATNQWSFNSVNKYYNATKTCPIDVGTSHKLERSPMRGKNGLCFAEQPYTQQCLDFKIGPGIVQDGELAATAAGLNPDQYGNADKLIFDKTVVHLYKGAQFLQAIIDYKKGTSSNTSQLKELIVNVSNKGGVRRVFYKKLWW